MQSFSVSFWVTDLTLSTSVSPPLFSDVSGNYLILRSKFKQPFFSNDSKCVHSIPSKITYATFQHWCQHHTQTWSLPFTLRRALTGLLLLLRSTWLFLLRVESDRVMLWGHRLCCFPAWCVYAAHKSKQTLSSIIEGISHNKKCKTESVVSIEPVTLMSENTLCLINGQYLFPETMVK